MDWLKDVMTEPSVVQTIIMISIVVILGLQLGKVKILNISLGATFVFFIGILVGHLKFDMSIEMLAFAQSFGLIIFIYALGLQVGPSFFSSLKKGGLLLNGLSLGVILIGALLAVALHYATGISFPNMMGILSGAVTNTPSLGAAQETVKQFIPSSSVTVAEMASACAVTYPLGVVGVIFGAILIRILSKTSSEDIGNMSKGKTHTTYIGEYTVTNPNIFSQTIREIMQVSSQKFIISRIWRDGRVFIPTSDSTLEGGDHLLIISNQAGVKHIETLLGKEENVDWNAENIDWDHIDNSHLESKRILVTRKKINGKSLEELKLRNLYGINITRVTRAGIDLLPLPNLALQIGDRLTVVGESASIKNVASVLGNEVKRLKEPNLIAIFLGIALGLILGSYPISIPGVSIPVKLGIAGGPIIVGILMGSFGPRFKITTYTTPSSNMMLRELGLVIYLACLGLDAGKYFFETVLQPDGFLWIGSGFILTMIPILFVGFFAMKIFKVSYANSVGMLCGSMANPIALNYINSVVDSDDPAVSYATVYPMSMFARIIIAQFILMFFL